MRDCFRCCAISMLAGILVGGVIAVSNKKVENAFKKGAEVVTDTFEDIKDKIEENTKKASKSSKE